MKSLFVVRSARRELQDAVRRYEAARPGLGTEFFDDIREVFKRIVAEPQSFPRWRDGRPYRKAVMLRRWPFAVIFDEREEEVRVWAVAHGKRRPGYWLRRTRLEP